MTVNELINEMYPFHNDICICSDQLVRLIGIAEDCDDFYYICHCLGGNIFYGTAVGACESLKGKINSQHYSSIDSTFELNGAPKTEKFFVDVNPGFGRENNLQNELLLREIFGEVDEGN